MYTRISLPLEYLAVTVSPFPSLADTPSPFRGADGIPWMSEGVSWPKATIPLPAMMPAPAIPTPEDEAAPDALLPATCGAAY